jgi:hypothetical protein
MNWQEIQNNAKLRLGNLPAADGYISAITTYSNEAQEYVIRRAVDNSDPTVKFPELRKTWTGATYITVDGQESYTLPTDMLILWNIYSLDDDTETTLSSDVQARKLEAILREEDYIENPREGDDFPAYFYKDHTSYKLLPVPSADYITNLILTGLKKPTACPSSNPQNSSPDLLERWHMAIADAIVYLISDHRGWTEKAAMALSQLDRRFSQTIYEEGEHKKKHAGRIKFRGMR